MNNQPQPIGIDLGTTFSAVARLDGAGRTVMVPNGFGENLTPSVVLFEDAEVIVGREALKVALSAPDRIARWVKRDMGHPFYSQTIAGQKLPPEAIQACVLRQLHSDIERQVGPAFQAVVTVPAFFDEPRRRATMESAQMAGLPLLDIVNEPTAAALAFGEKLGFLPSGGTQQPLRVMVYDLGGGTFDVTVVEMKPGQIRTLATDGDVHLGGYDWDQRLADYAAEAFIRQHGDDPRANPTSLHKLMLAVEQLKLTLSVRESAVMDVIHAGRVATVNVTRAEFEQMTADLLHRTSHTARQVLAASHLKWPDIDRVLLVGGSTRMPMVLRMLRELTGKNPHGEVHPDEAVARGAALYAAHILSQKSGQTPNFSVSNVASHSLGVEGVDPQTKQKRNKIMIPRNTPLPARKTKKFVTFRPNQATIMVRILEGESLHPSGCAAIGRTVVHTMSRDLPAGTPVKVTFEYGTNGRLQVSASVPQSGSQATLDLERTGARSPQQVAGWREVLHQGPDLPRMAAAAHREAAESAAHPAKQRGNEELSLHDDDLHPHRARP